MPSYLFGKQIFILYTVNVSKDNFIIIPTGVNYKYKELNRKT